MSDSQPLNTPETRQSVLKARVAEGVPFVLTQLAEEFGVSPDTIRRDLLVLEAEGRVQRVRGGALPVVAPSRPVLERAAASSGVAERIAVAARREIRDGMVLMLDGGTTLLQLARSLPDLPRALVVTPSPAVAMESMARGIETILIGGRLSSFGGIAVGQVAERAISDVAADLCLLGACGMEAGFGLGADDPDEAAVKRAMCRASSRRAVLTGASKLGRRARHRVLPCSEFDLLVTDGDADATDPIATCGPEILHA